MNKPDFRPRHVKNQVPSGWTPTKMRGKAEWRCGDIQYNLKFQEYRRCSYVCEKRFISAHKIHEYNIPQADDNGFPAHILRNQEKVFRTNFNENIITDVALVSGRLDISANKATSVAMRKFIISLLQKGYRLALSNNSVKIEDFVDPFSPPIFAEALKKVAQKEFGISVQKAEEIRFVTLICDAGTVVKSHVLHFMIVSNYNPDMNFLFETYESDKFDSESYFKIFYDVFEKLNQYKIIVCALTIDNLPAQVSGFFQLKTTTENPFIRTVMHIPCFSHLINLVFLNIIKMSPLLQNLIEQIMLITNIIRKNEAVNFIGAKCPTFSRTRWLYIVDILLFITSHKPEINNYLQTLRANNLEVPLIDNSIEFVYHFLVYLKVFSLIVEKKNFQMFNIVLLVRELLHQLKQLYQKSSSQFHEILEIADAYIRARFKHNAYKTVMTCFALSGIGRNEIRRKYYGIRTENPYALSFSPHYDTLQHERERFEFKNTPLIDDFSHHLEIEENNGVAEAAEYFTSIDEITSMYDSEVQNSLKAEFELQRDTEFLQRSSDIYENIYQNAKESIVEVALVLGINDHYVEEKYDTFLFSDPLSLNITNYTGDNPVTFWRKAYSYNTEWEAFSELALRFCSCVASEAEVERLLSTQTHIQNHCTTNITPVMLKSRLQLHGANK